MKRIIYVETLYQLLFPLILFNKFEENYYIFGENLSAEIKNKSLKKFEIKKYKNIRIKFLKQIFLFFHILQLNKILERKKNCKLYLLDNQEHSQYLLNNFQGEIILYEEGSRNYDEKYLKDLKFKENNNFRIGLTKKIIYKIKENYLSFGLSDKIKKIYLTGILPIPEIIKDKVEIINIETKWNLLSIEKKKEILDIFDLNLEKLENLKNEKEKILLITQPLSEDNIISEEEKIDIYSNLLKERDIKKIYIKPHPREKTDYTKVFQNIEVVIIEKEFPIEIFMLLNMEFKKVITLFSTAALNFKNKYDVEFIGTKDYKALYDKFGDVKI